jgi:hypothetical protein
MPRECFVRPYAGGGSLFTGDVGRMSQLKSGSPVNKLLQAQNKKYLCAIGRIFAGSHVRCTPSALTV